MNRSFILYSWELIRYHKFLIKELIFTILATIGVCYYILSNHILYPDTYFEFISKCFISSLSIMIMSIFNSWVTLRFADRINIVSEKAEKDLIASIGYLFTKDVTIITSLMLSILGLFVYSFHGIPELLDPTLFIVTLFFTFLSVSMLIGSVITTFKMFIIIVKQRGM